MDQLYSHVNHWLFVTLFPAQFKLFIKVVVLVFRATMSVWCFDVSNWPYRVWSGLLGCVTTIEMKVISWSVGDMADSGLFIVIWQIVVCYYRLWQTGKVFLIGGQLVGELAIKGYIFIKIMILLPRNVSVDTFCFP